MRYFGDGGMGAARLRSLRDERDRAVIETVREAFRHTKTVPSASRRGVVLGEWALRTVEERVVDVRYRRLGLDTRDHDRDELDATSELRRYLPTEWAVLRQIFPRGSLGPEDVLLDYGSGKGRVAVWVASRFPVRRIIGVEHDRHCVTMASANLESWRGPMRCKDITLTCADAREFDVPDDVTAVYMYNPFMGKVFDEVVARLGESLARSPRPLRVFYYFPIMHSALVEAGFRLERSRRHELYAWATYGIG